MSACCLLGKTEPACPVCPRCCMQQRLRNCLQGPHSWSGLPLLLVMADPDRLSMRSGCSLRLLARLERLVRLHHHQVLHLQTAGRRPHCCGCPTTAVYLRGTFEQSMGVTWRVVWINVTIERDAQASRKQGQLDTVWKQSSPMPTLSIAPLVAPSFFCTTVCSLYRKPRDCSVLRCVSLVPAKLRLSVMYSSLMASPLIASVKSPLYLYLAHNSKVLIVAATL